MANRRTYFIRVGNFYHNLLYSRTRDGITFTLPENCRRKSGPQNCPKLKNKIIEKSLYSIHKNQKQLISG